MKSRTRKLTKIESRIIQRFMIERGIFQKELASKVSTTQATISRILTLKASPDPDLARQIYFSLGEHSALKFLKDYPQVDNSANDIWMQLYDKQAYKLREFFSDQTEDIKAKVIGELERILYQCGQI